MSPVGLGRALVACFVAVGLLACSEPARPGDASGTDGASGDSASDVSSVTDASDAAACEGGAAMVCSGVCVDVSTDRANCGMCGRACGETGVCAGGVCSSGCGLGGQPCCTGSVCEEGATCTAGMCVANRGPQPTGRELVSSGGVMSSPMFFLTGTLGQSTQNTAAMQSTNFTLRGGLIGAIGGR